MTEHETSVDRPLQQPPEISNAPVVCICIATHRRPTHLEETLKSIAALRFTKNPMPEVHVIVVENDTEQLGLPAINAMRALMPWPIEYRVERQPGISFTRNTLVQLASDAAADLIAFIDDDELAEPQWLDELLAIRSDHGADAVLGPVLPRFESAPPPWLAAGFARRRHTTGSLVDSTEFRTGNVLLETSILREIEGPFDPAFALTGGSDAFLGREIEKRGARFIWADEAIIHETVPRSRATLGWFLRRRFRTGMALAMIRSRLQGRLRGSVTILVKGVGAIVYGLLWATRGFVSGRKGLLEGAAIVVFGLGGLFGLLGGRFNEYARKRDTPESNPRS
jgi:glycosyltransferase involved in cell wall biosynthesis